MTPNTEQSHSDAEVSHIPASATSSESFWQLQERFIVGVPLYAYFINLGPVLLLEFATSGHFCWQLGLWQLNFYAVTRYGVSVHRHLQPFPLLGGGYFWREVWIRSPGVVAGAPRPAEPAPIGGGAAVVARAEGVVAPCTDLYVEIEKPLLRFWLQISWLIRILKTALRSNSDNNEFQASWANFVQF